MTNRSASDSNRAALHIGVTCFLAYAACYLGKNVLSALMPQLLESSTLGNNALGLMGSVFLLTYGIGQFLNGMLGNRVPPRYMVLIGLLLPGLAVALFPFCTSPSIGVLLWGACGFASSMLWGPISRVIGENTEPGKGELLLSFLTIASMIGTLLAYALALFASMSGNITAAFLLGGIWMIVNAGIWFVSCLRMEQKQIIRIPAHNETQSGTGVLAFFRFFRKPAFVFMVLVTMLNGVIRNAVAFWIPTFLSQHLLIPSKIVSAVAVILPLINICGTFLTLKALKWVKNNEKTMCVILFALAAALFIPVFLCPPALAIISVISLFTASAAMTGACNMIFSVYVLRFRASGMISGITGFLDCSSYLSASAASLLFTQLVGYGSWGPVILVWIGMMLLGALASALANRFEEHQHSDHAKTLPE